VFLAGVARWAQGLWERARRRIGGRPATDDLLTGDALNEAQTYHDRNPEERQFVEQSRYWEQQSNDRNRALLGLALAVALFAAVGWLVAALSAKYAADRADQAEKARKQMEEANATARKAEAAAAKDQATARAAQKTAAQEKANVKTIDKSLQEAEKTVQETTASLLRRSDAVEAVLKLAQDPDVKAAHSWAWFAHNKDTQASKALDTLFNIQAKAPLSTGYSPGFLGPDNPAPLPRLSPRALKTAFAGGRPLDSIHFSVVLDQERRLAVYSAANLDRKKRQSIPRRRTVYAFDRRAPEKYQAGNDLYKESGFDRGALARRQNVLWGPDATTAGELIHRFTNTCPMSPKMNRVAYYGLDQWASDRFLPGADRVVLFGGPVFRKDDFVFRGYQIPRTYWRLVAGRHPETRRTVAHAFVLEHYRPVAPGSAPQYIEYPAVSPADFDPRPFQAKIVELEQLTGLDFGPLRKADTPLAAAKE
jgi:endonuclease G